MKKKIILFGLCSIVLLGVCGCNNSKEKIEEKSIETKCQEFTEKLQLYIDNKDYEGFSKTGWFDHEDLTTDECETIDCSCPSAWNLFLENKKLQAIEYLDKGLISSAYNIMGANYISENEALKEFYDSNNLFKLISSKQKEEVTGVSASFGKWEWKHQVGGELSFNKRYVNYGSSTLSLQFSNYNDEVLISGHLAPTNHPNWNSEKNISVNYYNYKVLDNKIYIKLKDENESQYDSLFEIVSLSESQLKLKLLINTTDVNKGQIYTLNYVRS